MGQMGAQVPAFVLLPAIRSDRCRDQLASLSQGYDRRLLPPSHHSRAGPRFTDEEMDKHLQKKILKELDGILVLAVNALRDLLQRDEFIIPESAITTADKYRGQPDSARA